MMPNSDKPTSRPDQEGKRDEARRLAEDALGAYADGDQTRGDELAEKAGKLDRSAVVEVIEEIDEDAGSDPDAAGRSG